LTCQNRNPNNDKQDAADAPDEGQIGMKAGFMFQK
jgi:hypothetical protein